MVEFFLLGVDCMLIFQCLQRLCTHDDKCKQTMIDVRLCVYLELRERANKTEEPEMNKWQYRFCVAHKAQVIHWLWTNIYPNTLNSDTNVSQHPLFSCNMTKDLRWFSAFPYWSERKSLAQCHRIKINSSFFSYTDYEIAA